MTSPAETTETAPAAALTPAERYAAIRERVIRLETEKRERSEDIKEVFSVAVANKGSTSRAGGLPGASANTVVRTMRRFALFTLLSTAAADTPPINIRLFDFT